VEEGEEDKEGENRSGEEALRDLEGDRCQGD
jgi:hypothetical protein